MIEEPTYDRGAIFTIKFSFKKSTLRWGITNFFNQLNSCKKETGISKGEIGGETHLPINYFFCPELKNSGHDIKTSYKERVLKAYNLLLPSPHISYSFKRISNFHLTLFKSLTFGVYSFSAIPVLGLRFHGPPRHDLLEVRYVVLFGSFFHVFGLDFHIEMCVVLANLRWSIKKNGLKIWLPFI